MSLPTSFPLTAVPTLIAFLRGQGGSRRAAAEAAYDLLGYALNVTLPEQPAALPVITGEGAFHLLSDTALAVRLEDFKADLDSNPQAVFSIPPWLVPILLEVVRRLLVP